MDVGTFIFHSVDTFLAAGPIECGKTFLLYKKMPLKNRSLKLSGYNVYQEMFNEFKDIILLYEEI